MVKNAWGLVDAFFDEYNFVITTSNLTTTL